MIQISQLKLPCTHTQQELREKIERTLRIRPEELIEYSIEKQSIDARKKPQIFYVYTIHASVLQEKKVFKKVHSKNITIVEKKVISIPVSCGKHTGRSTGDHRKWTCRTVLCIHVGRTWLCPNTSGARQSDRRAEERCRFLLGDGKLNPEIQCSVLEREAPELFRMEAQHIGQRYIRAKSFCVETFVRFGHRRRFIRTEAPHRNGYSDPGGKNMRLAICGAGGEVRFTVR